MLGRGNHGAVGPQGVVAGRGVKSVYAQWVSGREVPAELG